MAATDIKNDATLGDSLTHAWNFESGAATTDDVGALTLTDNNTVGSTTGKDGDCAQFVRANTEYYSFSNAGTWGNTGSISLWFNFNSIDTNGIDLVGDWDVVLSHKTLRFSITTGSKLEAVRGGDVADSSITGSTSLSANTWYHVMMTWDSGGTTKIYLNGSLEGTSGTNLDTPTSGTNGTQIGTLVYNSGTTWRMDGEIDQVVVWSKVLGLSDAQDLYNSGSGIPWDAGGEGGATPTPTPTLGLLGVG